MAQPCTLDISNIPDEASGLYLTYTIALCDEVVEAARLLWNSPPKSAGAAVSRVAADSLSAELDQWSQAICAGAEAEARLALTAALLRLCQLGHTGFLIPPPVTPADRIRSLVKTDPARDWHSRDVEAALGFSGATLRRRLAEQGLSLRDVIAHARLACALDLLYTTRWPIKSIAARVGYRSVSSFVQRFVERYGMEPGEIGNA
jgi:AraC-like DNA-binding protein